MSKSHCPPSTFGLILMSDVAVVGIFVSESELTLLFIRWDRFNISSRHSSNPLFAPLGHVG